MSLPTCVLMFYLAVLTLLSLILNELGVKLPFRMGSVPAGNVVRPAVFYIIEDVIAVDGNGRQEFREAWGKRYEGSKVFRKMVLEVSVVWMLVFFVLAGALMAVVLRMPVMGVYAVGWGAPFPVVGLLVVWTMFYVKAMLGEERKVEGEDSGGNGNVNGNGAERREDGNETTPLLANGA